MKLEFQLPGTVRDVFPYLSEMDRFASVHPAITRIDKTGEHSYLIHEQQSLWPFSHRFSYPANIHIAGDDHVIMDATVMRLVNIHLDIRLTPDSIGTRVVETIDFSSVLPVKPLLRKTFRIQHAQLFANIAQALSISGDR